jgi:hypothetical protein
LLNKYETDSIKSGSKMSPKQVVVIPKVKKEEPKAEVKKEIIPEIK